MWPDGRVQPVAALGQGFDQVPESLVAAGQAEVAAKLIEAARQGVIGDDDVAPEA